MSDPVTNVEIEDVLSSIRKLVSQGDEPQSRDSAPQDHEAPKAEEADDVETENGPKPAKLLLTPAQLVETAPEDDSESAPLSDAPEADEAAAPHVLDTPIDPEVEPDTPETEATTESEADYTGSEGPDLADYADPEPGPTLTNPDLVTREARRSHLEATIAELEASVGGGEFEPDGSEEATPVEPLTWPGHHPRINEAPDPVPDAPQDTPEEVAEAPSNEETTAEDLTDAYDDDLSGLSGMDEEALRVLVAEIVREELQGALGERITRNVRKLVRREIYRILSSQEFD